MQVSEFTDEELMAYADGELPEARAAQLDVALATDSAIADRLAVFVDTRTLAKSALDAELDTPVPDHLVQYVRDQADAKRARREAESDTVVPFAKSAPSLPVRTWWALPVAASLALAGGIGTGLLLSPQDGTGTRGLEIATVQDADIADALNTLPSGGEAILDGDARVALIATFLDGSQTLCREFELDRSDGVTVVSVACRDGGAWDVQMAVLAASSTDTGYAPASSLAALDAYLSATNAGPPLEPDAEAAALAALR